MKIKTIWTSKKIARHREIMHPTTSTFLVSDNWCLSTIALTSEIKIKLSAAKLQRQLHMLVFFLSTTEMFELWVNIKFCVIVKSSSETKNAKGSLWRSLQCLNSLEDSVKENSHVIAEQPNLDRETIRKVLSEDLETRNISTEGIVHFEFCELTLLVR